MNRNSKIHRFIKTLKEYSVTMAFGESITCGLASHLLSTTKGTSEVFKGSIVCYNEEVKTDLLKIPRKYIEKHSAESRQVTDAVARSLKKFFKASVYAAVTGLAAPGGSERKDKPVGTVFYTIIYKNKLSRFRKVFRGSPLEVREKACMHLYDLILKKVKSSS